MADWRQIVRARLKALDLTAAAEASLTDELAQHLEDLYSDLRATGASEAEACAEAVSELDDIEALRAGLERSQRMPVREAVPIGGAASGTVMAGAITDLRYAARGMRQHPAFVLAVVAVLGLGIGATATVFTAVNTLLLNPMPVRAPGELVAVGSGAPADTAEPGVLTTLSYPNFRDYRTGNGVFVSMAGFTPMRALTWQTPGEPRALMSEFVTGEYFPTLGVTAALGRTFGTEVDGRDGSEAVAVLNFGAWQGRFGGARDIIGTQLPLNGVAVTIVGVAPSGFIGANGLVGPELWVPLPLAEQVLRQEMGQAAASRSEPLLYGVARLRRGVTLGQAQANLAALAAALAREYPQANTDQTASVRPIGDLLFGGGSRMVWFGGLVLAAVAAAVLLIACSNAANLMLARSAARRHELAVRLALGATRHRVVRQLLTESVCLGIVSGGVGLLAAYVGMQLLSKTLPSTGAFVTSRLDATVLLFTFLVSLASGLIFGTMPALSASRAGVADVLRDSRAIGRSARRLTTANVLLVSQVALSFVLLVTAAWFVRSIQRAYDIDPGFEAARLAVFITAPGQAGYSDVQVQHFHRQVRERVRGLPGVESTSWASNMPLFARPVTGLHVEGRPRQAGAEGATTIVNTVDLGYFATVGVPIVAGRDFTHVDAALSQPTAIVNEKLARDFWPGESPLGKRVQVPGESQMRIVVGVVRNANYSRWGEPPQRCVYRPLEQHPALAMTLYVRSTVDPDQVVNAVRGQIHAVAPRVLITGVRTGRQVIDGSLFQARIGVALLSAFGILALVLASVGLYGILAYAVRERRCEIGVRMALGADTGSVRRLIVRQGMSLVATGMVIGLAAALLAGRLFRAMLFDVGPGDPVSLVSAAGVLGTVALAACYVPARRATRVDPLDALRQG